MEKMVQGATPNAEHIGVWNDILVPKFVRFRRVMVDGLGAHSAVALARYPVDAGQRLLDVGCGFGETSIELAEMVGAAGSVLGVDVCDAFLDVGRADARAAGVGNVSFLNADAQSHPFEPSFDLCFSRFGTTFFQNPAAALANLRKAVRPGGRLMMLVWRSTEENQWVALAKRIAKARLPPPPEQAPNCGPGPFSMSDPDTVHAILHAAGWRGTELEPIDTQMTVGDDIEEAIAFQLAIGPAGEAVREAAAEGQARRPQIETDLAVALRPFLTAQGVMLGSSSWCVTARSPT